MNSLIVWFVHNRVGANLLMVLILFLGLISLFSIRQEIFPSISLNLLTVQTFYPGASPSEVEGSVTSRIESALRSIPEVKRIKSISRDQLSLVSIEFMSTANVKQLTKVVEQRLNTIALPDLVTSPKIMQMSFDKDLVTHIVLYGDASERALKALAENLKQELLDLDKITQVDLGNVRAYEVMVNVSDLSLDRYFLRFDELVNALKSQTKNFVSGQADTQTGTTSIIANGASLDAIDLETLSIRSLPDGGRIELQDVAEVVDGFKEAPFYATYNGKPAVYLSIYRVGRQNILEVSDSVHQTLQKISASLPETVTAEIWQDTARYYKSRIDLLMRNAFTGLAMLFVVLLVFLNVRLSFWVTLGIPVAFMGAFTVLYGMDESLNMVSLFAFILVLGIVVDDAIIVGESIFSHQQKIEIHSQSATEFLNASVRGAQEVSVPVVFAVLTTMIMFSPLLFLPGSDGKMIRVIPVVVIAILFFSLVESLLILPAHLCCQGKRARSIAVHKKDGIQKRRALAHFIEWFGARLYRSLIASFYDFRYGVAAFFLSVFLLALGLVSGGWVKTQYFATIEADSIELRLRYPIGTDAKIVASGIDAYREGAERLKSVLKTEDGKPIFKNIVSLYGQYIQKKGQHLGSIILEMTPSEARPITASEIITAWKAQVQAPSLALEIDFNGSFNKPKPPLSVDIISRDPVQLNQALGVLHQQLNLTSGVYDIKDDYELGQQEVHLDLNARAVELGLTPALLSRQVSQTFYGVEIGRQQRGSEMVRVVLRYAVTDHPLWQLENMPIALPSGGAVPLHALAEVSLKNGPAFISRSDGKRSITVTAYVDEAITSAPQVFSTLQEQFEIQFPDVTIAKSGASEFRQDFLRILTQFFCIALLIMYGLMATLFRSYTQPLIVLAAIPFGMVGALFGHWILGLQMTLWSLVGITAVSGVVVNDNLVLLNAINQFRRSGLSVKIAIVQAGVQRFRPILLTTLTTSIGLLPLMLEESVQAKFMIPMAVSLAFGVLFATLISLVLVPVLYAILDDFLSAIKEEPQEYDRPPSFSPSSYRAQLLDKL